MERGFLSSNTKDKDKDDGGGEQSPVARLVKQYKEGKMLGRDGVNLTPVVLDRIETETMTKEDNATPFLTSYSNILKVAGNARKGNASLLGPDSSKTVRFRQLVNRTIVENSDCVLTKNVATVVKLFLFKFASKEGLEQVMLRGPWMIQNSPTLLSKWLPTLSLKKGEVNKVLVWVKLYNVLVLAYSGDGLSLNATKIGKPIISVRGLALKKEVVMAIEKEEGDKYKREVIRVEYE
ncbi:hypothetical protein Tco_0682397 [Tanacetum coccineum]|uniref:DUF4283 domain-containing protein n=1 Tax=Tanacetum coccineum TaxID=301880 RepID=A0ABQ4XR07_9ASTR